MKAFEQNKTEATLVLDFVLCLFCNTIQAGFVWERFEHILDKNKCCPSPLSVQEFLNVAMHL